MDHIQGQGALGTKLYSQGDSTLSPRTNIYSYHGLKAANEDVAKAGINRSSMHL